MALSEAQGQLLRANQSFGAALFQANAAGTPLSLHQQYTTKLDITLDQLLDKIQVTGSSLDGGEFIIKPQLSQANRLTPLQKKHLADPKMAIDQTKIVSPDQFEDFDTDSDLHGPTVTQPKIVNDKLTETFVALPPAQSGAFHSEVESGGGSAKPSAKQSKTKTPPRPNKLHAYANYTYRIEWHILTIDDYNNIIENNVYDSQGNNSILMATGGINNADRNQKFPYDFYMDNFEIETLVGLNKHIKASNATSISFTVTEPYGVTLIERLILAAAQAGIKASVVQQPYLLKIYFQGYNDDGDYKKITEIPDKMIPFKITALELNITAAGATYEIGGVPYHDAALEDIDAYVPYEMEIESDNIKKMLGDGGKVITVIKSKSPKRTVELTEDLGGIRSGTHTVEGAKEEVEQRTNGLVEIVNKYQRELVEKGKQEHADIIAFKWDEIFTDDKVKMIPWKEYQALASKEMFKNIQEASLSNVSNTFSPTKLNSSKYLIPKDKPFLTIVDNLMKTTEYARQQLKEFENIQKDQKVKNPNVLKWWKIIPIVKLGKWDQRRNKYQRTITYTITPYEIRGLNSTEVPLSDITPTKAYNYLYTGDNQDILEFNININAMYQQSKAVTIVNVDGELLVENQLLEKKTPKSATTTAFSNPPTTISLMKATDISNADKTRDAIETIATQLYNQSSQADFITANFQIIGDPDFIKQDQLFYGPNKLPKGKLPGESIPFDTGDQFADINILTPAGIDPLTDEMKVSGKNTRSIFGGVYKIMGVVNQFMSGNFTQQIETVRVNNQEGDATPTEATNLSVKTKEIIDSGLGDYPT
jgi:hypothetical protein